MAKVRSTLALTYSKGLEANGSNKHWTLRKDLCLKRGKMYNENFGAVGIAAATV